jgi:hypothetical protein
MCFLLLAGQLPDERGIERLSPKPSKDREGILIGPLG